jgi:TolA-binding protein
MRRTFGFLVVLTCFGTIVTVLICPRSTARADTLEPSGTPDPALQSYLSANGMLNRGLYELAAAEYGKFLADHADHEKAPVARYGLGVCLFRLKRYDAAAEILSPLHERADFPFAAEVGTILGQCHLEQRRYAEAADAFKRVILRHTEQELADDAGAGLVEALYADGRYQDAADACARFAQRWEEGPLRERVGFFWGMALMAQQEYARAAERFAELLDRFATGPFAEQASLLLAQCHQNNHAIDKAMRQYRRVLSQEESPYVPDALLGLATLLQQRGEPAEAGTLLDRLLERGDGESLRATARFQRGRAWFDQDEYERAFALFQAVSAEEGPLQDQAAYWMAKCRLRQGRFDEAARRLADAIEASPNSELTAEMLYDRAIALVRADRHEQAVEVLTAFRSRFPEHELAADALQLLASTEHQRRRFDESLTHARAFLRQYPSHPLASAVAFLAAENEFLAGRYADAVDGYAQFLAAYPDDGQSVKAKFRLGTALYRLERFDEADDFLAEVAGEVGADETYRPALLAMGDIHFQRSEWKQAERYLSDYLSGGADVPSADDALLKLGLAHQRQGQHAEALSAYQRLVAEFGDSPHRLQALFERGQALVALGRFDEAVPVFQTVVDQGGDSRFAPYALNHLAVIAMQRKDFDEAAKLYQRVGRAEADTPLRADALFQDGQALMAAQRFDAAEAAFGRFLEQFPSHERAAEAQAQRAVAMARQDRHAEAVAAIAEIERASAASLEPSLRAALQYEKAWCLRELGRSEEAAAAYQVLLDEGLASDLSAHAVLELTGIQVAAQQYEQAATLLRRLWQDMQSSEAAVPATVREQATYRLGVCEFELKRLREAADLFEQFIDAFPESPLVASASFYCGEALFTLGRYERAVEHLTRVTGNFPEDPVYGPSLLRLGESLAALQRWARSERVFTEYLERFRDAQHRYQAQFGVGWAREHQQRHDEAISAYRQVVNGHQGPTAARAQFQIGECLFAKQQYEDAVRELLKVDILYAYPEWSAAALYEAGRCFAKLGKIGEARAQFRHVADRHGDSRWAQLASQELSTMGGAGLPGK